MSASASAAPCRARSRDRKAPAPNAPSDMPSASPTTCAVAAVPRNWHPPPGDAHARQPASAACSSVSSPCVKRTPMVCTRPASSPFAPAERDAARHEHARKVAAARERHHHRGQALVAGRDADHAAACRQRSDQPAENRRGVVPVGQAVEHAVVPCERPSHGSVQAPANGTAPAAVKLPLRLPSAGRPPSGRCDSRARSACRRRRGCRRGCDSIRNSRAPSFAGIPAHAGVLRPAEEVARRTGRGASPGSAGACRMGPAARVGTSRVVPLSVSNGFGVMEFITSGDAQV